MNSQRLSQADRVHRALMEDLTRGLWRPGGTISVKETATRFRVSPTPVREALERLVGAGLVTVSNDRSGFVMPRLGLRGLVALQDTFGLLAEASARSATLKIEALEEILIDENYPVTTTTALFDVVFQSSGNDVISWVGHRLGAMLAPYWLAEPQVIPDWTGGMVALRDGLASKRKASTVRAYARLRRAQAARLVDAVEQGVGQAS